MKPDDQETLTPDGAPPEVQPKWRQDFPVDIPQDEYISRRDFTKYMVFISFAFVVGQIWILIGNAMKRRDRPARKEIANLDQIKIGEAHIFDYPQEHNRCVLVRTAEREFVAYSQACTHLSCPIIPDVNKSVFRCPCHEGLFEMKTGTALSGPPRRPLSRIHLEIQGKRIYATGREGAV